MKVTIDLPDDLLVLLRSLDGDLSSNIVKILREGLDSDSRLDTIIALLVNLTKLQNSDSRLIIDILQTLSTKTISSTPPLLQNYMESQDSSKDGEAEEDLYEEETSSEEIAVIQDDDMGDLGDISDFLDF